MNTKRKEIIAEYEQVVNAFADKLKELDERYGSYAKLEIEDVDATQFGDVLVSHTRNITLKALDVS